MTEPEKRYEIWLVDPNGDDQQISSAYTKVGAEIIAFGYESLYEGSGCSVELWRDGERVIPPEKKEHTSP